MLLVLCDALLPKRAAACVRVRRVLVGSASCTGDIPSKAENDRVGDMPLFGDVAGLHICLTVIKSIFSPGVCDT